MAPLPPPPPPGSALDISQYNAAGQLVVVTCYETSDRTVYMAFMCVLLHNPVNQDFKLLLC